MIDFHVHTNLSYCAKEDMDAEMYVEAVASDPELDAVVVTNHSMAIYFPPKIAWSWSYMSNPVEFDQHRNWGDVRLDVHLAQLAALRPRGVFPGLETEMMVDGRLTFNQEFRPRIDILIGSVHFLPVSAENTKRHDEIYRHWLAHVETLLGTGIDLLGHPFRWLANQMPVTDDMVKDIVDKAAAAGVALELNSHFKIPTDAVMMRAAAERGARVAFATDSHSREQVGDFSYHHEVLRQAGLRLENLNFLTIPA